MEEFQSDDAQGPERPPSGWAAPTAPHPGVQRAALDRRAVSGRDPMQTTIKGPGCWC